jgi:hypothetical protein
MANRPHIIWVFEDGETWSQGPARRIRLSDEEWEEIAGGVEPRKVIDDLNARTDNADEIAEWE